MGKFNYEAVKDAAKQLLIAIGEDPEREGLKETPRRIAGYWQEVLEGNQYTNAEIAAINADIRERQRMSTSAIKSNYFNYLGTELEKAKNKLSSN